MFRLIGLFKQYSVVGMGLLLLLFLFFQFNQSDGGLVTAQEGETGILSPDAFSSGGTINFQGQLTNPGGSPLTGNYNMRFAIYDAASGGNRIWPAISFETHSAVNVNNGLFSVQLGDAGVPINPTVFQGVSSRYLQIEVCTSPSVNCSNYDAMGRLLISSGAYAQTLVVPVTLRDSSTNILLRVENTGTSGAIAGTASSGSGVIGTASSTTGPYSGVYGQSYSNSGSGVYGYASAGSGTTYGVRGLSDSTAGRGVYGYASATTGFNSGVYGQSASPAGYGVHGIATATTGTNYGVYGSSSSAIGRGVFGYGNHTTGQNYGVYGQSPSTAGYGVFGNASAAVGTTHGVWGQSSSNAGRGVVGFASATAGTNYGVWGHSNSTAGYGLYGTANATTGTTYGVRGNSSSVAGRGVLGFATAATGTNYGVFGQSNSVAGRGALGLATATTGTNYGVRGESRSNAGRGVLGFATATTGTNFGVFGETASNAGHGVYGLATATTGTNFGVRGATSSNSGYAGYFNGRVHVAGTLSKSAGTFLIDHPLDPANKYLSHSFVESPDMMNVYNGNITLDANGEAWVTLPDWFEALNREFRYQLTPIGGWAPLYIAQTVEKNQFQISGGEAGMEVSWQVTGIRHDPYAEQNRIVVEQDKPAGERGTYLYPAGYGQPPELGRDYADWLEAEQMRLEQSSPETEIEAQSPATDGN